MKKKLIVLITIFTVLLSLVGCGYTYEEAVEANEIFIGNGYFTGVKKWTSSDSGTTYYVVYANDTNVMYFVMQGNYESGITPLYNADGSLMIYEGK